MSKVWWTDGILAAREGDACVDEADWCARRTGSSKLLREQSIQMMRRWLDVAPSGYYEWLKQLMSNLDQEDPLLLRVVRASFEARQGVCGAPWVFPDVREVREASGKCRVARFMRETNLRALNGYRTGRWSVGKPAVLVPIHFKRWFMETRPNKALVTDITYPHLAGLALPRRRDRPVLAQYRGLVHTAAA